MDNCIFCKILSGVLPSYNVWSDDDFVAFLSINPIKEGHTLVIPRQHTDYIFDMDDKSLGELMRVSKRIAGILKDAFRPKTGKIGVIVAGLEVQHAHLHLIPMETEQELSFANAKPASDEQLTLSYEKIKTVL